MAILMFKALHNLLPINIQNPFQILIYDHVGEKTCFHKSRTNLRGQCASNAGIRLWNALPDDITSIYLIYLFKRHEIKSNFLHCY